MHTDEQLEDCPLCCDPLSAADRQYPLHCPTVTCNFQFCKGCLQQLSRSAADDFAEASDGSKQVKVRLRCPVCRGAYENKNNEFLTAASIVDAVIKLRRAASIRIPGTTNDSIMSATDLAERNQFIQEVSLIELKEAVDILQEYHNSLDKNCGIVDALDWEAWHPFLKERRDSPKNSTNDAVLPRDPTIFMGLEELLSIDEQEFITGMMVSGKVELLAEAANILHGILSVQATSSTNNRKSPSPSMAQIEHQHRVRRRFPLPVNMPRCVSLPVYDPRNAPTLKFGKTSQDLTLAGIRGPAGKVGLRKGDVVTHVGTVPVKSQEEFETALRNNFDNEETFQLTVNANEATADALKKRAIEMKQQGIRFH